MNDYLFNLIDLPIIKFNTSNDKITIIESNKSYYEAFDISHDISDMSLLDLMSLQAFKWMKVYISFFYSSEEKHRFIFKDRHYLLSKVNIIDNICYVIHTDESEKHDLEDRLRRTQDIGKIGDWENDVDFNKIKWSDQMYKLLGEEPRAFIEDYESFMSYVHPDDYERVKLVNRKSVSDKHEFSLEFRIIDKFKNVKWMFSRGSFLYDDEGNIKKIYGMMQDISDNKHLEMLLVEEIKKSKTANEYKSKFLANMSHDIRTPLGSIIGMSKLLLNNNLDMLSINYVNNILSSSNILLQLVNDVLDLSKIESGKIELDEHAFDFVFLIDSISNIFQGKLLNSDIAFTIDSDESIPRYLFGDSTKLRQVLINIIGNAIKFTEKGYVKLYVRLRRKIDRNVDIEFIIEDTGIGIEREKILTIFDDYTQDNTSISRRFGGTGLGLAISKHLIDIMYGSIEVKSQIGIGSKFIFNVVLKESSRKEVEFEEDFFEPLFLEKSIPVLLAEDDRVNQIYFKTFLNQTYNFDVTVVDDGMLVLEEIGRKKYDIVFLDSNMPNLSGIETAKIIRELDGPNKGICLVALTAEAFKGDEERFLNSGFDYYLSKPINEEVFSRTIKTILKDNLNFNFKNTSLRVKPEKEDAHLVEYKYLSIENILEKSELLGQDYFLIIMEYAIEDYGEKYINLLDDLSHKDINEIYLKLHSVQGTLLYFSTNKLTDLIKNIEVCIKNNEYDNIDEFLNEFLTIFPLFIEELSDYYEYKKSNK